MNHRQTDFAQDRVRVTNPTGASSVVLVCEHATSYIPAHFGNLGLPEEALKTHIAWDPGALAVAQELSRLLDAVLIAGGVSRLLYDCNRPPDAPDAMPPQSEIHHIPGNQNLSAADKAARVAEYYEPFRARLAQTMDTATDPVLVTIHSFTPVYHGQLRTVEIGVLHDSDSRLADAMLACAADHTKAEVRRNQPYGPEHGVTHTLKEHALPGNHPNVMLEIRSDLIANSADQIAMASLVAGWLADGFARTGLAGAVRCVA